MKFPSGPSPTTQEIAKVPQNRKKNLDSAPHEVTDTEENLTQALIIVSLDPEITSTMGGGTPVVVQGTAVAQPYNPYEHKA